jgi:hypothetical protein
LSISINHANSTNRLLVRVLVEPHALATAQALKIRKRWKAQKAIDPFLDNHVPSPISRFCFILSGVSSLTFLLLSARPPLTQQ